MNTAEYAEDAEDSRVFCALPGVCHLYSKAITSISTNTSFGKRATSTVVRAGGAELKCLP